MKRHSALIPFSHSHHEALLVALRLKKGGPSSPQDTLWPTEPLEQAAALVRFAERELYPHFELEEASLFAASLGKTKEIDTLIGGLLSEHTKMRAALLRFASSTDVEAMPAELKQFGVVLERHIRIEERELFPLIEAGIESGSIALSEK